jgi:hypothetical protein
VFRPSSWAEHPLAEGSTLLRSEAGLTPRALSFSCENSGVRCDKLLFLLKAHKEKNGPDLGGPIRGWSSKNQNDAALTELSLHRRKDRFLDAPTHAPSRNSALAAPSGFPASASRRNGCASVGESTWSFFNFAAAIAFTRCGSTCRICWRAWRTSSWSAITRSIEAGAGNARRISVGLLGAPRSLFPTAPASPYTPPAPSLAPQSRCAQSSKTSPASAAIPPPRAPHSSPAPPKSSPRPD